MKKLIVLLGCVLCTLQINAESFGLFHSSKVIYTYNGEVIKTTRFVDITINLDERYIVVSGNIDGERIRKYYTIKSTFDSQNGTGVVCRKTNNKLVYVYFEKVDGVPVVTVTPDHAVMTMFVLDGAKL